MCDISVNIIKTMIEILSALLTPTVAICTACVIYQQKNIQQKQQKAELLKLRIEHIRSIFGTWNEFNKNIKYERCLEAKITVPNGLHEEDVIDYMKKARAELIEHNFYTKYLFTEEIYKLENEIIKSLGNFIPSQGTPFSAYNLPLDEYTKNREMFNDLYKKYEEIMDKENKLCK